MRRRFQSFIREILSHRSSLRMRLIGSYLLLALGTVALLGALALLLIRSSAREREEKYLTAAAETVIAQLDLLRPAHWQTLAENVSAAADVRVEILDSVGIVQVDSGIPTPPVYVHYQTQSEGNLEVHVVPLSTPDGSAITVSPPDQMGEMPAGIQVVTSPRSSRSVSLPLGAASFPDGYVRVSAGPDTVSSTLSLVRQGILFASLIAMSIAVIAGWLVGSRIAAPVQKLSTVAQKLADGDMSARAPALGTDELGRLAMQFNSMAAQIEINLDDLTAERDVLRRVIGDASHELRTPLTSLRTFNELLQGAAGSDPSLSHEFLQESEMQIERLTRIVENLLNLSRLEAGVLAPNMAICDVKGLVHSAAGAYRLMAEGKSIELVITLPRDELCIACDPTLMERALGNLLDNAIKFSPAGGCVEISVANYADAGDAAGGVHFSVADNGLAIPADDVPHLFERFYRGRRVQAAGSGLGLAIAQSIVHAHGGNIRYVKSDAGGNQFEICLPDSTAPAHVSPSC